MRKKIPVVADDSLGSLPDETILLVIGKEGRPLMTPPQPYSLLERFDESDRATPSFVGNDDGQLFRQPANATCDRYFSVGLSKIGGRDGHPTGFFRSSQTLRMTNSSFDNVSALPVYYNRHREQPSHRQSAAADRSPQR